MQKEYCLDANIKVPHYKQEVLLLSVFISGINTLYPLTPL